jgi:hypothetical protein
MKKFVKKPTIPPLPPSYGERIRQMGLRVVSYTSDAENVMSSTGERTEWLPRDIIAEDGKSMIIFRAKGDKTNNYNFSGWDCWHDGMFGGMRENLHSALAWIEAAREARAGIRSDFRGV